MEQQDSSMKVFKTPGTSPEPAQTDDANTCALEGCEAKGVKPRGGRCSQCRSVSYCSKNHQKGDWARHKETCKRISGVNWISGVKYNPIRAYPHCWIPQAVSIWNNVLWMYPSYDMPVSGTFESDPDSKIWQWNCEYKVLFNAQCGWPSNSQVPRQEGTTYVQQGASMARMESGELLYEP